MILQGKRIIVTGGVTGIGRATTLACAREGASVVSMSTAAPDRHRVTRIADQIADSGKGRYRHLQTDLGDRAAVDAAFADATDWLGGLDGLVHSAATQTIKPAEEVTDDDIMADLRVSTFGMVYANQAAFPHLKQAGGGSIVNITSYVAIGGTENLAAYGLAKGGVNGWSFVLARDWGKHMIRVNLMAPVVATTGFQAWYEAQTPEKQRESDEGRKQSIALGGRMGTAEDAADVNVFLLSDLSRYLTGQIFYADGGKAFGR
jgi:3-oxoacyl-[acyl-carrier protein] reductase